MPVRRRADRRRALHRTRSLRTGSAHVRPLGQLPQRHCDQGDVYAMRAGTAMATDLAEAGALAHWRTAPCRATSPSAPTARTRRCTRPAKSRGARRREDVRASVILLRRPLPGQPASPDGPAFNGPFTSHLLRVWKEGQFQGGKSKVPPVDRRRHAARSDAQLLHDRRIDRDL